MVVVRLKMRLLMRIDWRRWRCKASFFGWAVVMSYMIPYMIEMVQTD